MNMEPITYPARPLNGGALETACPRHYKDGWCYEPKYNGWRTLVHVPTRTMFNRHGKRLSISDEFTCALDLLCGIHSPYDWLDCEALERRHGIGKGTLIVLDGVASGGTPYRDRRERLELVPLLPILPIMEQPRDNEVYLAPSHTFPEIYYALQSFNQIWGLPKETPFYEGIVAKRLDAPYPIQLRSPEETTTAWIKHRWKW